MKLIDFSEIGDYFEKKLRHPGHYTRKRSLRATIVLAVVDAIYTGFFLGATWFEYLHGHDILRWIWPLLMAFTSGVGTLLQTVVALRNCPPSTKTQQHETAPENARA
jgi:hypothetical protein